MRNTIKDPLPRPVSCSCCQSRDVRLEYNSILYGAVVGDWPVVWYCGHCGASVGCHPGTDIPLGKMADRTTRQLRKKAHEVFDPIWRKGLLSRSQAYAWLADQLGIRVEECHISWFDAETCEKVIRICRKSRRRKSVFDHR